MLRYWLVDLKVVESEEGKSAIYLPMYNSGYSIQVKLILSLHMIKHFGNWLDERLTKLKKISKFTSNYQEVNICISRIQFYSLTLHVV